MHAPHTTYTSLRGALDESSEDWDIRLILADCCEEVGEDAEAEFWRWTYKHKKRAYRGYNSDIKWFRWWSGDMTHAYSYLSFKLYCALKMETGVFFSGAKAYSSNTKADDALFTAWKAWKDTTTPE